LISSDAKISDWVQKEYQHDQGYWEDRAKNGSGIIQQIARFVLAAGTKKNKF
jgi:hypothetical protein